MSNIEKGSKLGGQTPYKCSDSVCQTQRDKCVFLMVLKIGPDRPVRPAIGHYSGLVRRIGPGSDSRRSGQRLGGSIGEPDEPSVQFFFSFLLASARPIPVIFGH